MYNLESFIEVTSYKNYITNNLYTIIPSIIIDKDSYKTIKNNLSSGSIILLETNNDNVTELGILIDYIKGKGLLPTGLSKLLTEN